MRVEIDLRQAARRLAAAAVLLVALSVGLRLVSLDPGVAADVEARRPTVFPGYLQILRIFDVDAEGNVPTWLTSVILLICAIALWDRGRSADRWRRHWRALAMGFGYLSLDEVAQLHDRGRVLAEMLVETRGILTFGWVIFAAPVLVVVALAYLRFLRALPGPTRTLVLAAAVAYVGGAFGLELVGGWVWDTGGGRNTVPYLLVTSAEELLEMLGGVLLLRALAPAQPDATAPVESAEVPCTAVLLHQNDRPVEPARA